MTGKAPTRRSGRTWETDWPCRGHQRAAMGRFLVSCVLVFACASCIRMPPATGPAPVVAKAPQDDGTTYAPFKLKPEWTGPCARADAVAVNPGHAPATFVRAAHCQITGEPPPAGVVEKWTTRMHDE